MATTQFQLSEAVPQTLTNWKKEPTLLEIKADLDASKPGHDLQVTKINHWVDLMNVTGKVKPTKVKGRSSVQPKLIRRQAEWRYSALTEPFLGSQKLFKVSPVTFEDEAGAKQNELVLNWQFRTKLNRVKLIDDYVRATVNEGTCIIRVGWRRTTTMVQKEVPVWEFHPFVDENQAAQLQHAIEAKKEDFRTYDETMDPAIKQAVTYYEETGEGLLAVQNGTQMVQVEMPLENFPTVEIQNPRNFYYDLSCQGDLSKALFVIASFETNQAELKKEPKRYKNLDKVDWQNSMPISEPDHETTTPQDFQVTDILRKKVVAYEYWGMCEIHGDGVLHPVVVTWIGNTIIRMEENPYPDGKPPFIVVPYLPVLREVNGEPDAELLEDNQNVLGAVTRGMIDLLGRSANGQRGMQKGMLDALNKKRYDNGEDYEFNPSSHPSQGVVEHKYPELPQSALTLYQMENQEAEALTGVKSFSGGMSGNAYGDVAAGIRGMMDAASKREMAILRRLAKGMTEIGIKIIAMNAEFLSEEETVRVTNSEFVRVKREDLKGNFDLEVDISTVEVDNAKAQDMAFMLQTIGPNMPDLAQIIIADLCDLKRMPALAHKVRSFKPEPDPMVEQMKQLELQTKQMELQVLQSEVELNKAKAQQALAQKDKTDLDYVEQETGTAHAREMEKQAGQARGNQDLEVTKALAKPVKAGEKRPQVEAAIGWNHLSDKMDQAKPSIPPSSIPVGPGISQFSPVQM